MVYLALISPLRPLTDSERSITLWPPSTPLGAWLHRTLLAPWQRWDVHYYLSIVEHGYRVDDGTAQFHPLLAWLATPLAWLTGNALLGLLLVSSLSGALLLIVFGRLARLDLSPNAAQTATLLLLFSPPSWVLFAPYTEPLFLLWSVLCLLWARNHRWWLAGLAGALATLTRQQGLFLILPMAWCLWKAAGRRPLQALANWRDWLALGLIPLGLLIWLLYRSIVLGDLQANFTSPQTLIYSLLISPSANKVVPHQAFLPPWQALGLALEKMVMDPNFDLLVDLIQAMAWVIFAGLAWHGMRTEYRILTVTIGLVSFGYYTGPFYPYIGLPRHLMLAFPVYRGTRLCSHAFVCCTILSVAPQRTREKAIHKETAKGSGSPFYIPHMSGTISPYSNTTLTLAPLPFTHPGSLIVNTYFGATPAFHAHVRARIVQGRSSALLNLAVVRRHRHRH